MSAALEASRPSRFLFEEVTRHALACLEDRFSGTEFVAGLERRGIASAPTGHRIFGDFVIGVGRRPSAE